MNVLAVLQNMWHNGPEAVRAPLIFRINPKNFSGARLYRITEGHTLWVTNAASECGVGAKSRAPTDLEALQRALRLRTWDRVLVCGKQAQDAVAQLDPVLRLPYILMPHPAARTNTNELFETVKLLLDKPGNWNVTRGPQGTIWKRRL